MKQKLKLILAASAGSLLAFSVMAADTANDLTNASDRSRTNNAATTGNVQNRETWNVTDRAGDRGLTNNADNTVRNVRDRDNRTATPLDQGNSKTDIATTAQIRKEITAEKKMSVNARNVKIITTDGKITLRGPVNNAEEKRLIGEIANRAAQGGNVDNQLEVKITTSSAD